MKKYIILLAITALTGCATTSSSLNSPSDAYRHAEQNFENVEEIYLFWIPSDGAIADGTFITLSKRSPSALARKLADLLVVAKRDNAGIMIAGPNGAKTRQVSLDALGLLNTDISGLQVLIHATTDAEREIVEAFRLKEASVKGVGETKIKN